MGQTYQASKLSLEVIEMMYKEFEQESAVLDKKEAEVLVYAHE